MSITDYTLKSQLSLKKKWKMKRKGIKKESFKDYFKENFKLLK